MALGAAIGATMTKSSVTERVTVAFVHYRTPDLLETAVRSFKSFYRDIPTVIFDNGSGTESVNLIHHLIKEYSPFLRAVFNDRNIHHGPAMHRIMQLAPTEFVCFLDTDTVTHRGGFLERMCDIFDSTDGIYGVGRVGTVNRRGFPATQGTQFLDSSRMMVRVRDYHLLPPFEFHGLPVMRNFSAAVAQGYKLADFPIREYVHHVTGGTALRYGYGLGLKSKVEFLLNKLGL